MVNDMEPWMQMIVTVICSIAASSGFWAFILKTHDQKDAERELLIGIAHDRIMFLGVSYIERGWVTRDEYENFREYLCKPYTKVCDNTSVKKIMEVVDKLPIRSSSYNDPDIPDVVGGEIT